MDFSGANILITGGAGFIGANLARRLVRAGANVTIADSLIPEYGGNLINLEGIRHKVFLNITDVRDPHAITHLIKGQDFLFNLAGQTSHMDSMTDPFTDLEINAKAQLSILEACRAHNPGIKIVFAGTRQIYGRPDYLPVNEVHPLRPVDINGIHKVAGEWYHLLYNNVYGLRAAVLRLTNTYGPCMRIKDSRQTFVGVWIRLLLEGKPFEVWGGEQLRDFTYVDDCVTALLLAAADSRADGKVYNLGGDKVVNLRELADMLVEAHGLGSYVLREFPAERKKIDIGDYYSDDARIREELHWQPTVPLAEGLRRTLAYFAPRLEHYL
ncbi:NAD-dependent epimerase/dehydratase family protein [uncultured Desulfovibrio sp.]|uniref:NAD-dependent epimerase/dehydratase family protein n=1 Tax=uncultured Desulfovibrio sp. TaxID=167968 RepID=UPI0025927982|nr:NAD-dependent epimerase/dehydratase family protein [uncultured Desulfovibrio sp.]